MKKSESNIGEHQGKLPVQSYMNPNFETKESREDLPGMKKKRRVRSAKNAVHIPYSPLKTKLM